MKTGYDSEEVAIRILDIQTRIANLRSSIVWSEEPDQATKIEPEYEKTREVHSPKDDRSNKDRELEDIKAKLLGRKK